MRSKHPGGRQAAGISRTEKLLSTYIDALPELISPETGKIHTSFNQTVTATGRLSSTNPNLQNIPIRDELGREIRKAFIPDNEDCTFFSADYSQIELRIMAHLSRDEHMIEAFRSGADIHSATAAKIYGIPVEEVTGDMRRKGKNGQFRDHLRYLHIRTCRTAEHSPGRIQRAYRRLFQKLPGYPRLHGREYPHRKRKKGYVETIFKRKRYLPDINSHNAIVRGYAERNAINAPIQGSAADIIKVAMVRIYNRFEEEGLKSKMILQVRRTQLQCLPRRAGKKYARSSSKKWKTPSSSKSPLIADCGEGKNWLEAH